jgi:hypothetical protein
MRVSTILTTGQDENHMFIALSPEETSAMDDVNLANPGIRLSCRPGLMLR